MKSIENIHNSLVNGQRKQMITQIKEYGLEDFWDDYLEYLHEHFYAKETLNYFSDAVVSYFRITNR